MIFLAALAGGLALSAAGTAVSYDAAQKSAEASRNISSEQQNQETIREQAMNLDARRRQRNIIRQGLIAKSQALAVGTSQGAANSSGMQGAFAQIQGETNWGLQGVANSLNFGSQMFASNRKILDYRKDEASAGAEGALGAGLSSLGGKISGSATGLGNIFG